MAAAAVRLGQVLPDAAHVFARDVAREVCGVAANGCRAPQSISLAQARRRRDDALGVVAGVRAFWREVCALLCA